MTMAEAGDVVGSRYRLDNTLGAGGTGVVWRARDEQTGREVAIKQLRAEYAQDARLKRRLRREARAVARLDHPNIVRLYDLGEDDAGNPYLVMEYVEGPTLAELRYRTRLGLGRIVVLIDQILGALAFAHARGVIHRDLKPQNVVIAKGQGGIDEVKLLDFGLARVEDDSDARLTLAQQDVFGTPIYMSPEQATGDHEISPATDIYALGVVIWELLTGRPPYSGRSSTAIIVQHVTAEVPPLEPLPHLASDLPPDIEPLLVRALQKDPTRRFDSAGELRRALQTVFVDAEDSESDATIAGGPNLDAGDASGPITMATMMATMVGGNVADLFGARVTAAIPVPGSVTTGGSSTGSTTTEEHRLETTEEEATLVGAPAIASEVEVEGPREPPLVGREDEMRWLWERATAVCETGEPSCVVLEGAPGIGRRALGAELAQIAEEGGWMRVLTVRFEPTGEGRGLRGTLRGALKLPARAPQDRVAVVRDALAEVAGGDAVDAEAIAVWMWPRAEEARPPARTARVVEMLVRVLASARPVLLRMQGLEHAGVEGVRVLSHLVTVLHQRPAPVMLLGTRTADATTSEPGPLRGVEAVLVRHRERIEVRRIAPLNHEASVALAQSVLPIDAATATRLADRSGGNPFHVVQAVRLLWDRGDLNEVAGRLVAIGSPDIPSALPDLARARLAALFGHDEESDTLKEIAGSLTLLGGAFPFGLAEVFARSNGVETAALEAALEALVRHGLVVEEEDDEYAFAHGLMRDALIRDFAGRSAVAGLHARVAEAKTRWYTGDLGPVAARIGRHYRVAGQLRQAVEFLLLAARRGRRAFDAEGARALLLEAERWVRADPDAEGLETVRLDVALGLAELGLETGGHAEAGERVTGVFQAAAVSRDPLRVARARAIHGGAMVMAGRWAEGERVLQEALAYYVECEDLVGRAAVEMALGDAAIRRNDASAARERVGQARALARQAGEPVTELRAMLARAELAARDGGAPAALSAFEEAVARADELGAESVMAHASMRLGELLRQGGRYDEAAAHYRRAAVAAEANDDASVLGRCQRGVGDAMRYLGRTEEARTAYEASLTPLRQTGDRFQLALCFTQLGRMAIDADEPGPARRWFEQALSAISAFDDPARTGILHAFLARAAHRTGDPDARDRHLEFAVEVDTARPLVVRDWPRILEEIADARESEQNDPGAVRLLRRAAEVWVALRQPEEATRLEARIEAIRHV